MTGWIVTTIVGIVVSWLLACLLAHDWDRANRDPRELSHDKGCLFIVVVFLVSATIISTIGWFIFMRSL